MSQIKLNLGLSVSGDNLHWAMAINTLKSALDHIEEDIASVFIATDQIEKFNEFKELKIFKCLKFNLVTPRDFYRSIAPDLKGVYATYWKFDLFDALDSDEFLVYIDIDAFFVSSIRATSIFRLMQKKGFEIAAVPSLRPVLERSMVLQLSSPYNYFNAGVLMGFKNKLYEEQAIRDVISEIKEIDTCELMWHDQDIFNYMFNENYYKLSYIFNASTGYYSNYYEGPDKLNYVAMSDLQENVVIQHVSGGFLLSNKWHPAKKGYLSLVQASIAALEDEKSKDHFLVQALVQLESNCRSTLVDYILQVLYVRRRLFFKSFYLGTQWVWRRFRRFLR
jgi:lipopolysaccharide biosynthesis glycosyltransferase